MGNHWKSTGSKGKYWISIEINGHQRKSTEIDGCQWKAIEISGNHRKLININGNQRTSDYQLKSTDITGNQRRTTESTGKHWKAPESSGRQQKSLEINVNQQTSEELNHRKSTEIIGNQLKSPDTSISGNQLNPIGDRANRKYCSAQGPAQGRHKAKRHNTQRIASPAGGRPQNGWKPITWHFNEFLIQSLGICMTFQRNADKHMILKQFLLLWSSGQLTGFSKYRF